MGRDPYSSGSSPKSDSSSSSRKACREPNQPSVCEGHRREDDEVLAVLQAARSGCQESTSDGASEPIVWVLLHFAVLRHAVPERYRLVALAPWTHPGTNRLLQKADAQEGLV